MKVTTGKHTVLTVQAASESKSIKLPNKHGLFKLFLHNLSIMDDMDVKYAMDGVIFTKDGEPLPKNPKFVSREVAALLLTIKSYMDDYDVEQCSSPLSLLKEVQEIEVNHGLRKGALLNKMLIDTSNKDKPDVLTPHIELRPDRYRYWLGVVSDGDSNQIVVNFGLLPDTSKGYMEEMTIYFPTYLFTLFEDFIAHINKTHKPLPQMCHANMLASYRVDMGLVVTSLNVSLTSMVSENMDKSIAMPNLADICVSNSVLDVLKAGISDSPINLSINSPKHGVVLYHGTGKTPVVSYDTEVPSAKEVSEIYKRPMYVQLGVSPVTQTDVHRHAYIHWADTDHSEMSMMFTLNRGTLTGPNVPANSRSYLPLADLHFDSDVDIDIEGSLNTIRSFTDRFMESRHPIAPKESDKATLKKLAVFACKSANSGYMNVIDAAARLTTTEAEYLTSNIQEILDDGKVDAKAICWPTIPASGQSALDVEYRPMTSDLYVGVREAMVEHITTSNITRVKTIANVFGKKVVPVIRNQNRDAAIDYVPAATMAKHVGYLSDVDTVFSDCVFIALVLDRFHTIVDEHLDHILSYISPLGASYYRSLKIPHALFTTPLGSIMVRDGNILRLPNSRRELGGNLRFVDVVFSMFETMSNIGCADMFRAGVAVPCFDSSYR